MTMTVLEEMTKVMLAVPGPAATDEDVAAWYELKAHLLEHIAAEGGPDTERVRGQAEAAHRHSARLRGIRSARSAVGAGVGVGVSVGAAVGRLAAAHVIRSRVGHDGAT